MTLNFEFKHNYNDKAVLLFHGMTGSPFELKKFGQYLYAQGYDVYAECLPGHGDDFGNIMNVTFKDWTSFAYKKFETLSNQYREVFVGGLCLGALLALAVAEKFPNIVKGIIALSSTLYLDGTRMPWYSFLMPAGFSTITRFFYKYPEGEPYGIKNQKTRNMIKRLLKKNDIGLDNFPMTCIYELCKLSGCVQKGLKKIFAPIIIIHSREDDLTSLRSAYKVYNEISSFNKNLIILKDSYHMVLYDNEREYVFELCSKFLVENTTKSESLAC